MEEAVDKTRKWSKYYENHKKLWYDPTIPLAVKAVVRLVELHRSDVQGWSISIRKAARLLGMSKNTAMTSITQAIENGFLEASTSIQRKRRKLRLSVSLQTPVRNETFHHIKVGNWEGQFGVATEADSGGVGDPVNNKVNIKANIESQLKDSNESKSYKETEGYKRFIQKRKELGL